MASEAQVEYANWWSKVFCNDAFDRQFFIPVPPPAGVRLALEAVERVLYPPSRMAHLQVEKPVFIIGMPRSGTTMLYNLLCTHEQAAYITNCMNVYPRAMNTIDRLRQALRLNIRGERYLKDSVITDFGGPSELVTLWGRWTGRDGQEWDCEGHPVVPTEAMRAMAHEDLRRVLFAFGPQARRIFMKNPIIQTDLLPLQALFPDAHFVHIVRDGRMVANSLAKLYRLTHEQLDAIRHPLVKGIVPYPRLTKLKAWMEEFGPTSVETTARVYDETLKLVRRTAPQLTHFHELRYEDLLAAPEAETRRLFDFCDLPWPAADNARFAEALGQVGVIHHQNDYGDFARIEAIAEASMRDFGYLPQPVG